MAKAQAMKSKSSVGGWFRRFSGSKPQPARPAVQSTTMTNLTAHGASATKPAGKAPKKPEKAGTALTGFRLPFIGSKPVTSQMQILGLTALVLLAATAALVFYDTTLRTRNATYVTIASQMQFHTQRLAKAATVAARGQPLAFDQVQDSRDEFANYLAVLQNGGFAFGVTLPSAGSNDEIRSRLQELSQRWPDSANSATAILAARKDLISLARNIAQTRAGAEERPPLPRALPGPMTQWGPPPPRVLRANRLTFLAERLGRGSAEILGSETIDPEVPFLIGKDTNDLREMIRALESGSESMGVAAVRDGDTRAKLAELKKTFAEFEANVGPILRELQKLVTARQAGATLVSGSEQLQAAVGKLQDAMQDQKPVATLVGAFVLAALLLVVLVF